MYFLAYYSMHKSRVQQLYFIGEFLQSNVKHSVFVKLDIRYGYYLPQYYNYFGRPLRPKNSIDDIINSGKLFSDELTNWLKFVEGF